jgi:hypothetical protein
MLSSDCLLDHYGGQDVDLPTAIAVSCDWGYFLGGICHGFDE